jgi:hypothetical protein
LLCETDCQGIVLEVKNRTLLWLEPSRHRLSLVASTQNHLLAHGELQLRPHHRHSRQCATPAKLMENIHILNIYKAHIGVWRDFKRSTQNHQEIKIALGAKTHPSSEVNSRTLA